MNNLYKALFLAQQQVENAKKKVKNEHLRSKYADLKAVQEAIGTALIDNDLLILKRPLFSDAINTGEKDDKGKPIISGVLHMAVTLFHVKSGESLDWEVSMPFEKATAQGYGSAITYLRRYVDVSVMDMLSEDDDGEGSMIRPTGAKVIDLKKGVDNPKAA